MILVNKTWLPPFENYTAILQRAWNKGWMTNNGELVQELEHKLVQYLGVNQLLFCSNGTIVLQMALKALGITKQVITSPFSYVATTNAILWESATPVFVDIDPQTFCMDASKIEAAITPDTQAILATHVYGFPCDVETIQNIADKYNLKVIYDGAHAFGSTYKGRALLSYGDISTCSFHATKIFHTIEGGCIICNDVDLFDKLYKYRSFGHLGEEYFTMGINAKNSEAHAAMGLVMFEHIPGIISERKWLFEKYVQQLGKGNLNYMSPNVPEDFEWNYAYFPVLFKDNATMLAVRNALEKVAIFPRRYFYPSLNRLPFMHSQQACIVSEDVASKVLALPFYNGLTEAEVSQISEIVLANC